MNSIVMRKNQYRLKDKRSKDGHSKRKQFLVDPSRVELDQYMLTQIKKNKRSMKSLNKEVVALRKEVHKIQEMHDDYMLLEKTRAQEYSHSHLKYRNSSQQRIALTQAPKKTRKKSRQNSKESSLLSVSSSNNSLSNRKYSSKSKNSRASDLSTSKSRLSRKIEQIKIKAILEENQKERIKKEVKEKISKIVESRLAQTSDSIPIKDEKAEEDDYLQLVELLKTSKTIKEPSSIERRESPKVTTFKSNHQIKESIVYESPKGLANSHSKGEIPLKSNRHIQESEHYPIQDKSETNLLESSPSKTPEQSPKKERKLLQMSRAVEVKVRSQNPSERTDGSACFEGFGFAGLEVKSGTVEMSFEAEDSTKRRLKQLQFEVDQLVRQQLATREPKKKEMLAQTIRSLLCTINELKCKTCRD